MQTTKSRQRPLVQDPQAVRKHRVLAGLRKKALAAAAGISPAHMTNIELGQRSASEEVLHRLAAALDCEVTALMAPELRADDTVTSSHHDEAHEETTSR